MFLGFLEDAVVDDDGAGMDYEHLDNDPENIPHKIGGKPLWLNPAEPLNAEQVQCGVCSNEMSLLFQLFTPEDYPAEAFLRIIYLFTCKNGKCHKRSWKDSFKCFRSQLPEDNLYWGSEPDLTQPKVKPTCRICGLSGSKRCGKCNNVHYCGRSHQELDWKTGGHSVECKSEDGEAMRSDEGRKKVERVVLFPEYELVTEREPDVLKPSRSDESLVDEAETLMKDVKVSDDSTKDEDADFEETETGVDKAFLKFQKRLEREPEQVVR
ncbi:Programmed cell death protein 2 [Dinochytrium kinnereticum]|nr:Programmed cell death protein 2 [Dinochytrium kinnereticum]